MAPATLTRIRDMKKKPRKGGRPPMPADQRLGNPVEVRLTDRQRDLIDRAIERQGGGARGGFIRDAAVARACEILGETE